MASQARTLHRSLLRPLLITTLRAAGFQSTRPSVLDTLVSLTENYLLLLASTTAQHAWNNHNDPYPTVTDVRMAMQECGILLPALGGAEETWIELMRKSVEEMGEVERGGEVRKQAVKRKREIEDVKDVREFEKWVQGEDLREMKRIAGMLPDASGTSGAVVGVGGGVVQADDFLATLKKKGGRGAVEDGRFVGTVLGREAEGRGAMLIEGGPAGRISDWRPRVHVESSKEVGGAVGSATAALISAD